MANLTHLNQPVENLVMLISDAPGFGEFYNIFTDGSVFAVDHPFRVPKGAWLVVTDVFFIADQSHAPGESIPFALLVKDIGAAGSRGGEVWYPLRSTLDGGQSKHIAIQGGLVVHSNMQLVPETGRKGTIRLFGYLVGAEEGWADQFRDKNPPPPPPESDGREFRAALPKRKLGG